MRPSSNPGEVAILDKRAECKVVHDALTFHALHDVIPSNSVKWDANNFGIRFHNQTRQIDTMAPPVDYEGRPAPPAHTWQDKPEFRVLDEDRPIVRAAAEYILDLNNVSLPDMAYNFLTGRTRAAKKILKTIPL